MNEKDKKEIENKKDGGESERGRNCVNICTVSGNHIRFLS